MDKNVEISEHILVCISPSPSNMKVIAEAVKMADAFHATLTAIYVKPTNYDALSSEDKTRLQRNIRYAEQCGASITTIIGDDVPVQVAEYAHFSDTTKIVVGRSGARRRHFWSKAPLTSISGNVSNLLSHYEQLDEETLRQIFSDIYDDSEWLVDLVEELLARLRVTIRRLALMNSDNSADRSVYTNGRLEINYSAGCAFLNGEELKLTPMEYKLLCLLAKNTGKVLTHTYITQNIWGRSWDNDIASLRVFMVTLRKKLESAPDSPRYIQTHIGIGYRMLKVD